MEDHPGVGHEDVAAWFLDPSDVLKSEWAISLAAPG